MASEKNPDSVQSAAEFSHEHQLVFPSVSKACKLLLIAPVSVAKDERTFSKLKIVKNCLRSTMKDERLKDLIVLACEKDLADTIELQNINAIVSLMFCYIPHFSQGNFQFRRAKVSDTPPK